MKKLTTILIIFLFFKTNPCHCQQDTSQIAIPRIDVQGHHQFSTKEILKTLRESKKIIIKNKGILFVGNNLKELNNIIKELGEIIK